MNSLSNHDTPRILTLLSDVPTPQSREERAYFSLTEDARARAKEKLFCAIFMQFVLPGSPCIYYGDEAGLEGYEDPFNRRFFPWGKEDKDILSFTSSIAAFRRASLVLRLGETRIDAPREDTLCIRRVYERESLLCLLTRSGACALPDGKVLFSHKAGKNGIRAYGCAIIEEANG